MYLLDTNVVSELRRPRPHGAVLDWIAGVPAEQLFVSAVTIGEIQAGIEITREQDEAKAEELESLAGQGPGILWRVADGRARLPGVGEAHARAVGNDERRRYDRGDSRRS